MKKIDKGDIIKIVHEDEMFVLGYLRGNWDYELSAILTLSPVVLFSYYLNKNKLNTKLTEFMYSNLMCLKKYKIETLLYQMYMQDFSKCVILDKLTKRETEVIILKNKLLGIIPKNYEFGTYKEIYDYIKRAKDSFLRNNLTTINSIIEEERSKFWTLVNNKNRMEEFDKIVYGIRQYFFFITFTNRYMYLYSSLYGYKEPIQFIKKVAIEDKEECFRLYLMTQIALPDYHGTQVQRKDIKGSYFIKVNNH